MQSGVISIEIGWPAEVLSPNVRVHFYAVSRAKKAAKEEAYWATRTMLPLDWKAPAALFSVHLKAHPPQAWRTGDRDNFVARCKAALDGIANALGVNDRQFLTPTVEWAERRNRPIVIIEVSASEPQELAA